MKIAKVLSLSVLLGGMALSTPLSAGNNISPGLTGVDVMHKGNPSPSAAATTKRRPCRRPSPRSPVTARRSAYNPQASPRVWTQSGNWRSWVT